MTTLAPVHRVALVLFVVVLAGCGSSSKTSVTTTVATPKPGPGTVLYRSGDWAVVFSGGTARALQLAEGSWQPDTSGLVKGPVLGPHGTPPPAPQDAAE